MYRSVSRCKCARISSSNSVSGLRLPNSFAARSLSRAVMLLLPFQAQYTANHARDALPVCRLALQLLSAALGDGVEPGFAIVLRGAPIGIDPALLLEPQQRGIYGAFVQLQHLLADLFDAAGNAESMKRPQGVQCFQDHEVERALQHFRSFGFRGVSFWHFIENNMSSFGCPPRRS